MQLNGTTALVTGSASGLGAATAAALTKRGARVIGLDLPAALADARQVSGVEYVAADVTNVDEVRAAVERAHRSVDPLRTVVNCAGIGPSMRILGRKGVHDIALFAKVLQVNLLGTFTVLATAAEAISATEADEHGQRGVVVNTASIAAFDGQVGQAAYASSRLEWRA